ncbi:MAG: hypothetical protein ACD_20C00402G0015 [uncultured bacterium]|nr:MAG: hypothetical protein ACD_20C00402G0015 [uncultured bacterium]HBH18238.1 hypothetical protein [Cyanobacteria bacterium UBA9579]
MKKILITSILCIFILTGCMLNQGSRDANNSRTGFKKENKISQNAKVLLNKGIAQVKSGDNTNAIKSFNELINKYPDLAIGYYNLGLAYAENKNLNKAINSWEQAVLIDDSYADAYYNLGLAYKTLHNKKKAAESLANYISIRPDEPGNDQIRKELAALQEPYQGKGIIGLITLSDKADQKNKTVLNAKNFFNTNTNYIYAALQIADAARDTDVKVIWYYITSDNQKLPVNLLKFTIEGSKNVLLSLKRPEKGWPIGDYELDILVNGKINDIVPFEVLR